MAVTTPLLLYWRILHSFVVMCTGGYRPSAICCCRQRLLRAIHCSCTGEYRPCACISYRRCRRPLRAFVVVVVVGAGDSSAHSCYLTCCRTGGYQPSARCCSPTGDTSVWSIELLLSVPVEANRVPFSCCCRRSLRAFFFVCGDTACLFWRVLHSVHCDPPRRLLHCWCDLLFCFGESSVQSFAASSVEDLVVLLTPETPPRVHGST
jgi:hypothetical protein